MPDVPLIDLPERVQRVRRAAFRLLRRGAPVTAAEVAADAGVDEPDAAAAIDELERRGLVRRAGGAVVAVSGLSLEPTRHELSFAGGGTFGTWCAADALGIPAALGEDATARTSCPSCGRSLVVEVAGGRAAGDERACLWVPSKACAVVVEEFCPDVNLFCDRAHLEEWRAARGSPQGDALPLEAAVERVKAWWADAAPAS